MLKAFLCRRFNLVPVEELLESKAEVYKLRHDLLDMKRYVQGLKHGSAERVKYLEEVIKPIMRS